MAETPPPLRINSIGGASFIPVYEIDISSAAVTRTGPTRIQIAPAGGGATTIYAPTGGEYVTYIANNTLSAERILTAGSSVTVVTDGTNIYISALTGGGGTTVYAATGNQYLTLSFAGDLTAERVLSAASGLAINDLGANNSAFIYMVTPVSVSSGGTGAATFTNRGFLIGSGVSAIQALAAMDQGQIIVGSSTVLAPQFLNVGSAGQVLGINNAVALSVAWVSTGAGGGSGTVNAGSATYLSYYPAAGSTVDDFTITGTTGVGVSPLNVYILTSPAASIASGDVWIQASNGSLYLMARSSSTTYGVELSSV